MKKMLWVLVIMALFCAGAEAADNTAQGILRDFLEGNYEAIEARFSPSVREQVRTEVLEQGWMGQLSQLGAFVEVSEQIRGEGTESLILLHENGQQKLTVAYDGAGDLIGLNLQNAGNSTANARSLPEGVSARAVTLFEGTERELKGEILIPAQVDASYVVLVQGSGPSDLDGSAYALKPIRDIAYDLAALGVGSIRFGKVTFAHPELPCETVVQEYLEPVAEGLRVLREEIDANRVYLIGHSEGGMLMPWLVQECGFDGGVSLAGTPRRMWEVIYQQGMAYIPTMAEEEQEAALKMLEAEFRKARSLMEMTGEEAAQDTVFGVAAEYLRHLETLDILALAKESGKPMLFLWGERDVQVLQVDYDGWKTGLENPELYSFRSYPELNHMFVWEEEGLTLRESLDAYQRPADVDPRVASDIASWLEAMET